MLRQLICIIFLGFGLQLSAQSTNCNVGLVLQSVEAEVGDTVLVDVTVRNFSDIVGMQYNHQWNPLILDFVAVLYPVGSAINGTHFNFSPALLSTGLLNFSFLDNNLTGLGLADNSILYQLSFIYQGGGTAEVSTNGASIPIEFIDNTATVVDNYYVMHATVGPHQQQDPPADAYPYPTGVCIQGQACNETTLGSIILDLSEDQINSVDWTGPNGFSAAEAEITGLTSGVYQLTLTHNNGRITTGDYYVGISNTLNLTLSTDADECGGDPDGSVMTAVEGGSGNYSYSWSNGATSPGIENLVEGDYSVTVTDLESNCSVAASVIVSGIASFPVWYDILPASCDITADGAIVVFAEASGDELPLTYLWSNGSTTPEISGLLPGAYEVTITAANGCVVTQNIYVWQGDFFIDADVVDDNCSGEPSGSITLSYFTAESNDIHWSTGESGTNTISGLTSGVYSVTVTDQGTGCSASEIFLVGQQSIIAAASIDCYLDNGASLADLNAVVWNNDDGPYTFDWSNGISNTALQISSITVSENGIYDVTITSASGCTSTVGNIEVNCLDEATVNLYFNPVLSEMNNGETRCFEVLADGFTAIVGLQFSINWDEEALDFTGLGAFNLPDLEESDFGIALADDGKLTVSWIDLDTSGESLPAGSPLFEVCFEATTTEATNTTIGISGFPTLLEIINSDFDILITSTQSSIVYLNGGSGGGTDEFELIAGSASVEVGNNTCVPVSIGELNDLIGFQFALAWDPSALQYTGVQALNLPYFDESSSFGSLLESQNEGRLRVIWNDFTLAGLNLAEETVAFEACFLATGPAGDYSLTFDNAILPTEAVNANFEYMSITTIGGTITITDDPINNPDHTSLRINSVAVAPGEELCVPVEVVNFDDMVGMQFSINWDDELLTFNGVEVVEGPGFLTESDFNLVGNDALACAWLAADLVPRSFAEGTVLFKLCYTAANEEGSAGIIFSNQPTAIEFVQGTEVVPFVPVNGVVTISSDGLVWPGDLNNDGTANNMDGLHLGLAFGATGPARNNPSNNWIAQYAAPWLAATPQTLTNYRHIDADGNGLINASDTLALSLNWTQNSDGLVGSSDHVTQLLLTGAPIYIPEQTVQAGVRVRLPIMLGTEEMMVEDAYGIAFTIVYETDKVELNSPRILYNGWLGSGESGDLIGLYNDHPDLGKVEVVMVRTDGQNVDGSGQLAELSIIMEDVIILSLVDVEAAFSIENVRLISYEETELETSPRTTSIVVEGVTAVKEPDALRSIELSPNPTDGLLRIAHRGLLLEQSSLQDAKGSVLQMFSNNERIDLGAYPAGIYFLRIQTNQGVAYRKVIKR
jgi:hypothetical protein